MSRRAALDPARRGLFVLAALVLLACAGRLLVEAWIGR